MENKKGVSKGLVVSIFIILILVLGIIGGAFYIYCNQPKDIIENTLDGGNISLTYTDETNLFTIENPWNSAYGYKATGTWTVFGA